MVVKSKRKPYVAIFATGMNNQIRLELKDKRTSLMITK